MLASATSIIRERRPSIATPRFQPCIHGHPSSAIKKNWASRGIFKNISAGFSGLFFDFFIDRATAIVIFRCRAAGRPFKAPDQTMHSSAAVTRSAVILRLKASAGTRFIVDFLLPHLPHRIHVKWRLK
jgi:hypothetical protein